MYACIADLKDRLIREGHGVLEVLGLFSASAVARDIGQVIARSHRRQHQHSVQGLLLDG